MTSHWTDTIAEAHANACPTWSDSRIEKFLRSDVHTYNLTNYCTQIKKRLLPKCRSACFPWPFHITVFSFTVILSWNALIIYSNILYCNILYKAHSKKLLRIQSLQCAYWVASFNQIFYEHRKFTL